MKDPTKSAFENKISAPGKIEEAVFLGLRLTEGINAKEFKLNYGIDIYQKYSKIIEKYIDYGFMTYDSSKNLKLTKHGILLSNSILADFLA